MSRASQIHAVRRTLIGLGRELIAMATNVHLETAPKKELESALRSQASMVEAASASLVDAAEAPDTRCDFTVEGSGSFPFDMLRYDDCWPVDGAAVESMLSRQRRVVRLRTCKTYPTPSRWESFNWTVTELQQ